LSEGQRLPTTVLLLFKRSDGLKKYGPANEDDDHTLVTFTSQVDDAALMVASIAGNRRKAMEMLFEFETVWTMQRLGYFLPIWMTQGTGMVMASVEIRNGKCVVGTSRENLTESYLESGDHLAWPKFFSVSRGSPEYTGKKQAGVYQLQSWALMHWLLLEGGKPRVVFEKLAAAIKATGFSEAVESVSGFPPEGFGKAIGRHFRVGDCRYETAFDEKGVRGRLKPVPAPDVEVHVQLANALASAKRDAESDRELELAASLAPDSVAVKEAGARKAIREDRKDDAVKLYREAIDAGSTNARAILFSASARLDEYSTGNVDYAGGGGPSTEVALQEIRRVLKMNSSDFDAYRLMGRALFVLPRLSEEMVAELEPAVMAGEDGCRVRYYRALLRDRLGDIESAIKDLRTILDDSEASNFTRRSAQALLARLEKRAARKQKS
jgi:tetratricopeptide (TPR) repeat protein